MRTSHRGLLAASLSLAALAACTDRAGQRAHDPTAPRGPGDSPLSDGAQFRATGGGTASLVTAAGTISSTIPRWRATATMTGGVAISDPASSPLGALAVARPNRLRTPGGGGVRYARFTDDSGNTVDVAWIFAADGGPVRAVQLFVNGSLTMVTDYSWAASHGGWTLNASTRRAVVNGRVTGAISVASSDVELLAAHAAPADAVAHFAAGFRKFLLPRELDAQILSGPCRTAWLEYIAATAALAAAISAWEKSFGNPVLLATVLALSAKATIAEMNLWLCLENAAERASPGGLGAGTDLPPLGCLEGTYSPVCDGAPEQIQ